VAHITIVPLDGGKIEISCGGENKIDFVASPADGQSDSTSGGGSGSSGGNGSGGGDTSGTGSGGTSAGGDGDATPSGGDPTAQPIFIPPPVLPFFAGHRRDEWLHWSFARVDSTEALQIAVSRFTAEVNPQPSDTPRHLVVFLAQRRIDIRDIVHTFSPFPDQVQVTVYLTRPNA
jgi:hypothetical protein